MFVSMQNDVLKQTADFVSVKQYADLKGTTVQAVYGKINRKTLVVKRIGNLILVKDI